MYCPHCSKDCDPVIDPKTLDDKKLGKDTKAICEFCLGDLNLNKFILQALLTNKKIYQPPRREKNLYKCKKCNKDVEAELKGDIAVCAACGTDLKLTIFMLNAIKIIKGKGSIDCI